MRYLLSNLLVIAFVSCASYPKKKGLTEIDLSQKTISNPYFSDASKDYVYKANIEAFGNSFSGIFIVKKLGEDHHRIAFTTEMGNKIFDFTFHGEDFKVNHILKKMNKKILVNILRKDFRVLVSENLSVEKTFKEGSNAIFETQIANEKYYHFIFKENLTKVYRVGNGKEKVEYIFSEISHNIAKHIEISHQNFDLTIDLEAIK